MKANKKTLMAVKNFFQNEEGWDLRDIINETVCETKLLKHKSMGEQLLDMDECWIEWGDDEICNLDDFVDTYTRGFLEKVCNVIDSFVGEDLSYYEDE